MLINRVMTKNPIFVSPDMSITEVHSIMDKEKIGHVPVLDKNNTLVGLMTRKSLVKAAPSAATGLDMFEISYLLSKTVVKDVMEKKVLTAKEDDVVEEVARIMADKRIGCLPVMKDKILIGIITQTDLFRVFVDACGARYPGVRFTINIKDKQGQVAKLSQAITELGGNIVAFITFDGDDVNYKRVTIKTQGIGKIDVQNLFKSFPDIELEDIRE